MAEVIGIEFSFQTTVAHIDKIRISPIVEPSPSVKEYIERENPEGWYTFFHGLFSWKISHINGSLNFSIDVIHNQKYYRFIESVPNLTRTVFFSNNNILNTVHDESIIKKINISPSMDGNRTIIVFNDDSSKVLSMPKNLKQVEVSKSHVYKTPCVWRISNWNYLVKQVTIDISCNSAGFVAYMKIRLYRVIDDDPVVIYIDTDVVLGHYCFYLNLLSIKGVCGGDTFVITPQWFTDNELPEIEPEKIINENDRILICL